MTQRNYPLRADWLERKVKRLASFLNRLMPPREKMGSIVLRRQPLRQRMSDREGVGRYTTTPS